MFPTFPDRDPALCTCTDFARRGLGTCKHIEAAAQWLRRHADAPVPPAPGPPRSLSEIWNEVDRRIDRMARSRRPESIRIRDAGAALFEPAPQG
jgi:hypothetical protein